MNLVDKYQKVLIINRDLGNIYVDGRRVGRGQAVITEAGTANTLLGSIDLEVDQIFRPDCNKET